MRVKLSKAFQAWVNAGIREKWLADPNFSIRKANEDKSLRITWVDGKTSLDVYFYPKKDKVQISLNHGKLENVNTAETMKKYRGDQLASLTDYLLNQ